MRHLVAWLIEYVDDNGWIEWDEISDLIKEYGEEKLSQALAALRQLGPPGLGARNLQECLTLQLSPLDESPAKTAALNIVQNRLHWFLRRRFDKLPRRHLSVATALLESLSSSPGRHLSAQTSVAALPDIEFYQHRGLWKVRAGPDNYLPRAVAASSAGEYMRARQLVAMVAARRRQLLKLAQLVADYQSAFLSEGFAKMRAFPMYEAAQRLSVSPSMISHMAANKYFLSPHGIYALKLLFERRARIGITVAALRANIQTIIANENTCHPFSDTDIQKQLRHSGIVLARRTVGKHREAIGMARASLRKKPFIKSKG